MAITKRNKRQRNKLRKKQWPQNANVIRVPKDNTISLVVWNDKEGKATRTPLSTEEAGNVAMYLAKNKGVVPTDTKTMVDRPANQDALDQLRKSHDEHMMAVHQMNNENATNLRKEKKKTDALRQTLGIIVSNQRALLDAIQNMIVYPVYEREDPPSSSMAAGMPDRLRQSEFNRG